MDDKGILLIDEKFLFDISSFNQGIKLQSKLFTQIDIFSTLIIETTDLFFKSCWRVLFILREDADIVIKFDKSKINTDVKEDGGIIIPEGNNLIKIGLDKNYEKIKEKGIKLIGYGFGLKTIYAQ